MVEKHDPEIIGALLRNSALKERFFVEAGGAFVFKTDDFRLFMEDQKIDNTYLHHREMLQPAHNPFPFTKKECELMYGYKVREEEILAKTMAPPLQKVSHFGNNEEEWENKLIFGDNLQTMQSLLRMKEDGNIRNADGTPGIRLVYIDPPFASQQEFTSNEGGRAYQDKLAEAEFLEFIRQRIILIRELLSDDGSVYVHLDYRMNSYIRVLMDEIFGKHNFRNEIIWKKANTTKVQSKTFGSQHDVIFLYSKSANFICDKVYLPYDPKYIAKTYRYEDERGQFRIVPLSNKSSQYGSAGRKTEEWRGITARWIHSFETREAMWREGRVFRTPTGYSKKLYRHEAKGVPVTDLWTDSHVSPIQGGEKKGIDYPTQKPIKLLERVIKASSKKGDIVADFFAGSGTTCVAAEMLDRRWIGADCGKFSIYTIQKRILNSARDKKKHSGTPCRKSFALYNAGLYDVPSLSKMAPGQWREFALKVFECEDKRHEIGGIEMEGYKNGKSVMMFDHGDEALITENSIDNIHSRIGKKVGGKVYIIAPSTRFAFMQDWIEKNEVRYHALRLPELHWHNFPPLSQPASRTDSEINKLVHSAGFAFVDRPEMEFSSGTKGENSYIQIMKFGDMENAYEPNSSKEKFPTFSMLMIDYDYPGHHKESKKAAPFHLGKVFFVDDISENNWTAYFPKNEVGEYLMAIFVDKYGNEARELIPKSKFIANRPASRQIAISQPKKRKKQ